MINEVLTQIVHNLSNVGFGVLIFIVSYLSNMFLSLYYNVKVIRESFEQSKLIKSAYKILLVGLGTGCLSLAVTTLPIFADYVGWSVPDEYKEVFANIVIISVYLYASCRYVKESYDKLKLILINDTTTPEDRTLDSVNDEIKSESFSDTNSTHNILGG